MSLDYVPLPLEGDTGKRHRSR